MAEMNNTDYLRWRAKSLKDMIKLKLTQDGQFTDHLFEDSNLSVLINIFSYTYDALTYYLNHTGTEAIFSDSQLYENLNRIVKMLDYKPLGFKSSNALCNINLKANQTIEQDVVTIPRYTTVTLASNDRRNAPIQYSFVDDFTFPVQNASSIDPDFTPILYNGVWKAYKNIFQASSIPFETFSLDLLPTNDNLTIDERVYVAHPFINVYVKSINGTYTPFTLISNIYDAVSEDAVFEIRINENKQYQLKFGDGVHGKKLALNDEIYILYLESNGPDGVVGANKIIEGLAIQLKVEGFTEDFVVKNLLNSTLGGLEDITYFTDYDKIYLTNPGASSNVKDFETVDEIRENAPNAFRMQGRTVTAQDVSQYIKANYRAEVYDNKVMDNWDYMVNFQSWLYSYGKLSPDIRHYEYKFADTCDFNNVYIWMKSFNTDQSPVDMNSKLLISRDLNRLKPLTSEIVLVDPLMMMFSPYINVEGIEIPSYTDLIGWTSQFNYKIELVRDKNSLISVSRIQHNAMNIIKNFFDIQSCNLGMLIDFSKLYQELVNIKGVKQVKTVYDIAGKNVAEFNGLSFAAWTPLLMRADDFIVVNGSYKLQDFQFPMLFDKTNLGSRVKVTSDNFRISAIEY